MSKHKLRFYNMMDYPIPQEEHYFYYKTKITTIPNKQTTPQLLNKHMQTQINTINKYKRLRKHLPYIQHIYICDGTSFAAAHEKSDIDLFFVTKKGCLWRARFRSVIICSLLGIKRSLTQKSGFFDLIFYVDEEYTDLEHIAITHEDIYLHYRLAHLIPLYQYQPYNIYQTNQRIQKILPNFPLKHSNPLPIQQTKGKGLIKTICEFCTGNSADNFWEQALRRRRKPKVIKKSKSRNESQYGVIITDHMLKFHKDKRKEIQAKRITITQVK